MKRWGERNIVDHLLPSRRRVEQGGRARSCMCVRSFFELSGVEKIRGRNYLNCNQPTGR